MFVGMDGVDWETCGVVVVFSQDCLVVEVDSLDDLFFLKVGVDGDGVRCVGDRFCCSCVVWCVEDVGEACEEGRVVEVGVGDDGGGFLGVVCFVCVDDEKVCWV